MFNFICCFFLEVVFITALPCQWHCERVELMPPTLSYDGKDLPMVAALCNVNGNCEIDMYQIITNLTSSCHDVTLYAEGDIYFNCSGYPYTELEFSCTDVLNYTFMTKVSFENCNITWYVIEKLGRCVYVKSVHISMHSNVIELYPVMMDVSTYSGLSNITQLQLSFIDIKNPLNLVDFLPGKFLPNVTILNVRCAYHIPGEGVFPCLSGCLTFNISELPTIFPQLQNLELIGSYPLNNSNNISFPWDKDSRLFPYNMSRSSYDRLQCSSIRCLNSYTRALTLMSTNNSDIFTSFKISGALDGYIFKSNQTVNINLTDEFFQNVPEIPIIDLSFNQLKYISANLFKGLRYLEQLYFRGNYLRNFETGAFDDQIQLKILDLSDNSIYHLHRGIFRNLLSLKVLNLHQNSIISIDYGSFPLYSLNLTFVDLRWNLLEDIPPDCLTLPNIQKCDMDHNTDLSFKNWLSAVNFFDPIKMLILDRSAYSGEDFFKSMSHHPHSTDMSELSFQNCKITSIPYSTNYSMEFKLKLAAFLSFYQIKLDGILDCDCSLYDFKLFIQYDGEARDIMIKTVDSYNYVLSNTNFQNWVCKPYKILTLNNEEKPFLLMDNENFLCKWPNDLCPKDCKCFTRPADNNNMRLIDCSNGSLTEIPKNLENPGAELLVVSFENNNITSLVNCELPEYSWLKTVRKLVLKGNSITPEQSNVSLEFFLLQCLPMTKDLDISNNNIKYLPPVIMNLNFSSIKIDGNKFACDCHTKWMKIWLTNNQAGIKDSWKVHCYDKAKPIIELEAEDFVCEDDIWMSLGIGLTACVVMSLAIALVTYKYLQDIKIILFDKLSLHPFDNQTELTTKYHVFLLYHDKDYEWAQQKLFDGLVLKGYKVYDRNKNAGDHGLVVDELVAALQQTNRVIVVLSEHFCNDVNMLGIFSYVEQERNERGIRNRFIIIIKECSGDMFTISEALMEEGHEAFGKYLRTNYYIDIKSKRFWPQLFYWLPLLTRTSLPNVSDPIDPGYVREQQVDVEHQLEAVDFVPDEEERQLLIDT